MKQLTCEMCGGTDLVKSEGVFVCQTCGCKYSLEEARKMMFGDDAAPATASAVAPAKPNHSEAIENYLQMAKNAIEASNNEEAENYANKIIELAPRHSEAWLIKGEAAGWQSKGNNNRMPEAVTAWHNAVSYAEDGKKEEVRYTISTKYINLWQAMITLRTNFFGKLPSVDNKKEILSDVDSGIRMMNDLTMRSGVSFNRALAYDLIAKALNTGAVDGYQDASNDFGPEHHNMSKWQWDKFTGSCDSCIELLDKATYLVRNPSLAKTICNNKVFIGTQAKGSSSWKFDVNSWTADHYVKEYSFTASAMAARQNNIDKYEKEREEFLKDRKGVVLKEIQGDRAAQEITLAQKKYWEEHQDEKQQLLAEKEEQNAVINELNSQMKALPIHEQVKSKQAEIDVLQAEISTLTSNMNGLGLFKNKEKKALQVKITDVESKKAAKQSELTKLEQDVKVVEEPYEGAKEKCKKRIAEIDVELTKERGRISLAESRVAEGAYVDGEIKMTSEELCEGLAKLLPHPFELTELIDKECNLQPDIARGYFVRVINNTLTGENKNTGVSIQTVADGKDQPIKAIYVEMGDEMAISYAIPFVQIASIILGMLTDVIPQSDAEEIMADMLYDQYLTRTIQDGLYLEYADYTKNINGLMNITRQGVLIRAENNM